MDYVWGTEEDCENWRHRDESDALTEAFENGDWACHENEESFTVSIFRGEVVKKLASQYAPKSIAELMEDAAYNDIGELSEGWTHPIKFDGFDEAVKIFIDAWCTANDCQPDFYQVVNVKEVKFQVTMENPVNKVYQDIKDFVEIPL